MRILVVDDDQAVRDSLSRTLRFEGYDVETAHNGQEALEAVRAGEPDAMVLDVSMPQMDGLQACQQLRREGLLLPILMLTARDTVGDRVAGLDAGADDCLVKPFALQELQARVRALLRRSQLASSGSGSSSGADSGFVETGSDSAIELSFDDLRMNQLTREVWRGQRLVPADPEPEPRS